MTDTKRLPIDFTSFEADGHVFRKNLVLAIERYEAYQKLQLRMAQGLDFNSLFNQDKKIFELLNKQRFADCAAMIYNRMSSIKGFLDEDRQDPTLMACALATLREDEDPAVFDEKFQIEKINNWRKEGYAMEDFFLFAAAITNGLPTAYNEYIIQESEKAEIKAKIK